MTITHDDLEIKTQSDHVDLIQSDSVDLRDRLNGMGITDPHQQALFEEVTAEGMERRGVKPYDQAMGILYHHVDGTPMTCSSDPTTQYQRYRLGDEAVANGQRYTGPPGERARPFFSAGLRERVATGQPVLIVEGEKKAAVAASNGAAAVGIPGWSGWRRPGTSQLHEDWEELPITAETNVYLCPDFDGAFNPDIHRDINHLAEALYATGVKVVKLVTLPPKGPEKLGLDDYLLGFDDSRAALDDLLKGARPLSSDMKRRKGELIKWITESMTVFRDCPLELGDQPKNLRHAKDLIARVVCKSTQDRLVTDLADMTGQSRRALKSEITALQKIERKLPRTFEPVTFEFQGQEMRAPYRWPDPHELGDHDFGLPIEAGCLTNVTCVPSDLEWSAESIDDTDEYEAGEPVPLSPAVICGYVQYLLGDRYLLNSAGKLFLVSGDDEDAELHDIDSIGVLDAAVAAKTGAGRDWSNRPRAVKPDAVIPGFLEALPRYEMIRRVPEHPLRGDTYYLHRSLPVPSSGSFDQLLDFFRPATPEDRVLIACLIVAGFWSGFPRPMFLVDSDAGQMHGKSTLVEMACRLWGEAPLYVDGSELNGTDRLKRRLVVGSGLSVRAVFYDNAVGTIRSGALAQIITSPMISAMGNHAKEESRRVNDCIFLVTMNGAAVDRDMATRTYTIMLAAITERDPTWQARVEDHIERHRWEIIAHIIERLQAKPAFTVTHGRSRFAAFEEGVMNRFCSTEAEYHRVMNLIEQRQESSDEDRETWVRFTDEVEGLVIKKSWIVSGKVPISNTELQGAWMAASGARDISPVGFGKQLKRAHEQGLLAQLQPAPGGRIDRSTRGWFWVRHHEPPAEDQEDPFHGYSSVRPKSEGAS